jgi:hypothetical protein
MAVTVEDIMEAATNGVLRALDARRAGGKGAAADVSDRSVAGLVRSGFNVDFYIRAGGYPGPWVQAALNPQPLPPKE